MNMSENFWEFLEDTDFNVSFIDSNSESTYSGVKGGGQSGWQLRALSASQLYLYVLELPFLLILLP
jgi:hypothetical protein